MVDVIEGNKDIEVDVMINDEKFQFENLMLRMVFIDEKKLQTFYSNYAREEEFGAMTKVQIWEGTAS